jgi:Uma2 family endonuclease
MNIAPLGREATLEDLWEFEDPAELIDGRIVPMSPKDFRPGQAANRIHRSLETHQTERGGGQPVSQGVGFSFETPRAQYFIPDVFWWTGPVPERGGLKGGPSFAAEVRSESDYGPTAERAMAIKRAHYFAGGTQVVWDVDVLREGVVRVYRAEDPEHPTIFRRGEIADAEPAVPGWWMPVDELFA